MSPVFRTRVNGFWENSNPTEAQVAAAWENRLFQGDSLQTLDGRDLQVVFPGRKSGFRGPDFSDALIAVGGLLHKGEVEIHVRSSDFTRHGHDKDPHYDNLVLHVVLVHDTSENMLNGSVPIFEMGRVLEALPGVNDNLAGDSPLPCANAASTMGTKRLLYHLESAGTDRFMLKAGRFLGDICYFGEEEALYQGVMEALGYSQNKEPFLNLARAVPYTTLQTILASSLKGSQQSVHNLLLWASSLEADVDKPAEATNFGVVQIKPNDWELSRLRPDNHPLRRIEGISHLIARANIHSSGLGPYLEEGLLTEKGFSNLVKTLSVHAGDKTLIGSQRASEIGINVVLPFAYAQAEQNGDGETAEAVLSVYKSAAKTSENHISNQMYEQFGLSNVNLKTACQQQGLLHIYKEKCQDLRCVDCPIALDLGH